MASFNLLEEPWIPCVSIDSRDKPLRLSLRRVFERATELEEIVHPSPLATAGIHRLLLAVLHRSLGGPGSLDEWHSMWSGGWETHRLNAYLDVWKNRFDLFDEEKPFYQTPYMDDAAAREHPIVLLMQERASGNNATLFDHNIDDNPTPVKPADAACYLIARQAYSIGGGVSKPFNLSHSTLVRGLTVKMVGENLFETLMLNLVRYKGDDPIPRTEGDDAPAWEQEEHREPDRNGTVPTGYVDYLTWQSRRVHLISKGNPPMVVGCQIQQNLKPQDDLLDPFKTYRRDERRGWVPLRFDESRALWRDSHTLLQDVDAVGASRISKVINWAARINNLREQGDISIRSKYTLEAVGIATDPAPGKAASVIFWRQERLPLPLTYLNDKQLSDSLKAALELTEKIAEDLNRTMKDMAKGILGIAEKELKRAQRDRIGEFADHLGAGRAYWSRLEAPFKRLLVELPDDKDEAGEYGGNRFPKWKKTLRDTLRAAFNEATRGMERSPRNLKALALAERSLATRTHKLLTSQEEEQASDDDTAE